MTTFASIALYLIASAFLGTFGMMVANGESRHERLLFLSLFIVVFTTAAGLQVFG